MCVCVCACMYACMRVCAHHTVNMLSHLLWHYLWLLNPKNTYECAMNLQFIALPSQWYYCTLKAVQIILQRVRHDSKVCLFEKLSLSVYNIYSICVRVCVCVCVRVCVRACLCMLKYIVHVWD